MPDSELVAVFNDVGEHIGIKTRKKAHEDKDWHLLVFVIAARIDKSNRIRSLMQIRSGPHDAYRGQIDLLAGGHVYAEESPIGGAIRECYEECRILLEEEELTFLGKRFFVAPTGTCRHAIEYFYLCERPIALEDVDFSDEVNAFVEVDLDELGHLISGIQSSIPAQMRTKNQLRANYDSEISIASFSAYSEEIMESFRRVILSVRNTLRTGKIDEKIWR